MKSNDITIKPKGIKKALLIAVSVLSAAILFTGCNKKSEEKINKYKRKIYNSKKIEVCNNNQCESNLDLILNSSDEILGDLIDN